ncbi:Protein tanc2 [Pleodorina starrii]|uniref:Protein tanc2 n=1 Tax=Pleodorina starrii TaxID=330485 RepID=A0A9W6F8P5_9CHLO|nr:Protein tanc2 [Pleodorina starrii]GLC60479.1 Protein tanc2 [Pleodorina starrii]GLC77251.1 Protein tanc2 [Pleodorina starrii]
MAQLLASGGPTPSAPASGRPAAQSSAGLLDLPVPILQLILASSGRGGAEAACACSALRDAFQTALACPDLVALFLLKRFGPATALFHVYNTAQLRQRLLGEVRGGPGQDAATDCLIRKLLRLGASPRVQERFMLAAAAGAGDTQVVRTLLRAGVNAGASGGRALVAASAAGHVAAMEVLLRAGVSARAENGMPLRAACREGRVAAAQLLLRYRADPRAAASDALAEAARGGHLALVLELLAAGADPRVGGSRALAEAEAAGHGCVVLALQAAGAQSEAKSGPALRKATKGSPDRRPFGGSCPAGHAVTDSKRYDSREHGIVTSWRPDVVTSGSGAAAVRL